MTDNKKNKEEQIKNFLGVKDFRKISQLKQYNLTFHVGNYFTITRKDNKLTNYYDNDKSAYKFITNNTIVAHLDSKSNQSEQGDRAAKRVKRKLAGKYSPFEVGHLLAIKLIKYLNIDHNIIDKLGSCPSNLIHQFSRANGDQTNNHGQEYFERTVWKYMDTCNKNADQHVTIHYEAEKIFRNDCLGNSNAMPIGTRILAYEFPYNEKTIKNLNKYTDNEKITLPFHVFIPNYQFNINYKDKKICLKNQSIKLFQNPSYIKNIVNI